MKKDTDTGISAEAAEHQIETAFKKAGFKDADLRKKSDEENVHVIALTGDGVCRVEMPVKGLTKEALDEATRAALAANPPPKEPAKP